MKLVRFFIAPLLLLVILSPSIYKAGFIAYFYSNQSLITELYCINKDKPALNCQAKCYLSKNLSQDTQNPKPAVLQFLEGAVWIGIVTETGSKGIAPTNLSQSPVAGQSFYNFTFVQPVFHPPIA